MSGVRRGLVVVVLSLVLVELCAYAPQGTVVGARAIRVLEVRRRYSETIGVRVWKGDGVSSLNLTGGSFGGSKRKVPTCPDPLHNRRYSVIRPVGKRKAKLRPLPQFTSPQISTGGGMLCAKRRMEWRKWGAVEEERFLQRNLTRIDSYRTFQVTSSHLLFSFTMQ
ncbi:unnamed protein product [Victoria cruziana]